MKIVFIEPVNLWKSKYHPIGLLFVSGYLKKNGYPSTILGARHVVGDAFRLSTDELTRQAFDAVRDLAPDVLGFSARFTDVAWCNAFGRKIRSVLPSVHMTAGGAMPSIDPSRFLNDSGVFDSVVVGEGEETMLHLIRTLEGSGSLESVDGLVWRNGTEIVRNQMREPISDLDTVGFPDYDAIDLEHYISLHPWIIRGFPLRGLFISTSRGCPYQCTFCAGNAVFGKKVRFRSPDSIRNELTWLVREHGLEGIFICDDTFVLNRSHILAVCEVLKDLRLVWSCFARVDAIKEDILDRMLDSGCIQIDFGVESGSDRLLRDVMKKNITVAQTEAAFALCHRKGMRTFANLMMGLPTETEEEINETYDLAKRLNAEASFLSMAMPMPGTELFDRVKPDLSDDEWARVDTARLNPGIVDRCNRSEVPTDRLIKIHKRFTMTLRRAALRRTLLTYPQHLRRLARLPHPVRRIAFDMAWRIQNDILGFPLFKKIYFAIPAGARQCILRMFR